MKSYLIHFIRHGAIDETLAGKYIGVTDVALSEKARRSFADLIMNVAIQAQQRYLPAAQTLRRNL